MFNFKKSLIFFDIYWRRKYPRRLEDTLNKEKTNWKPTLRNQRNEFIKNKKYENKK